VPLRLRDLGKRVAEGVGEGEKVSTDAVDQAIEAALASGELTMASMLAEMRRPCRSGSYAVIPVTLSGPNGVCVLLHQLANTCDDHDTELILAMANGAVGHEAVLEISRRSNGQLHACGVITLRRWLAWRQLGRRAA
jgi:hypothetical protein